MYASGRASEESESNVTRTMILHEPMPVRSRRDK